MKIVCIAWGSLLWNAAPLLLSSGWKSGGPRLPLEFSRDSDDSDELAIVISEDSPLMPTWWALMESSDIEQAREQLRQREKVSPDHPEWIGTALKSVVGQADARVEQWLATQDVDAAIWTAVPPKFDRIEGRMPTIDQAVDFLSGLQGETREKAQAYVRRIPAEIMTPYRVRIGQVLDWTPVPVL